MRLFPNVIAETITPKKLDAINLTYQLLEFHYFLCLKHSKTILFIYGSYKKTCRLYLLPGSICSVLLKVP